MNIKEILVLHHSHFDVGYTHSQPVLWELQREFLDEALILLRNTEDWPEQSRPKWTIEVTAQLTKWLETASAEAVQTFQNYCDQGRIGLSAMLCHTTPLANAEQLIRQIYPIRQLREQFGLPINTLNQHDVNGTPWPLADIMLDSGIELFIMAINLHMGGLGPERPAVFWWEAPSGRRIRVMNGAHYTMLDQHLDTHLNSLDAMRAGLDKYLKALDKQNYPHDFLYLTTANPPICYDNSPPNPEIARLIRTWNEAGNDPPMRYITPDDLLTKIREMPEEQLKTYRGDWTDYWNYGCASNAESTKTNMHAKPRLMTRDMIATRTGATPVLQNVSKRAWWYLNFYDEHTWGSYNSMDYENSFSRTQAHLKDANAYKARELAEYLIVHELEALSKNPASTDTQEGVLLVNSAPTTRSVHIPVPDYWHEKGKRLRTARFAWNYRVEQLEDADLYGPIEMKPYSWQVIPFKNLVKAEAANSLTEGEVQGKPAKKLDNRNFDTVSRQKRFIESPYHRLEYEEQTGRITRLYDKLRDWEVLPTQSEFTFFEICNERPHPLVDSGRTALYSRNLVEEKFDISGWQTEWRAEYRTASRPLSCKVTQGLRTIALTRTFEAPGTNGVEQHITLSADSDEIRLKAVINKADIRTPESIYFTFPLNLDADWRCHFDTAGMPVELDADQLPGVCRDWFTVETFVSMHEGERSASLYCPDAPMIQAGDFNYGRWNGAIKREENPLLLAWPMNNYWDTNFRASQPGRFEVRYTFRSHGAFDALQALREARSAVTPIEIHPAMKCEAAQNAQFVKIDNPHVSVTYLKPAEDLDGIICRLQNMTSTNSTVTLTLPAQKIVDACLVNPLELKLGDLDISGNGVRVELTSRQMVHLRLKVKAI